jgi:peptide/nickel transport system permease protein
MEPGQTSKDANPLAEEGLPEREAYSIWRDSFERLLRNKMAVVGLVVVAILFFVAIFGSYLTPYDYLAQNLALRSQPPSSAHWLGTDNLGRDLLSRVILGAQTATLISLAVVGLSSLIGIAVGSISGYMAGKVDSLLMWFTDLLMAFPNLVLGIVLGISLRPPVSQWMERMYLSTLNPVFRKTSYLDVALVVAVITIVAWCPYARLLRSQVLAIRNYNYVVAARALGVPPWIIVTQYIIPNAIGPVIVQMSAGMGSAMLTESAFSFLGIGINPPIPSWGNMINDGLREWTTAPHILAVPAIVLGLATVAFSFLGDGLNDALNPRQWKGN